MYILIVFVKSLRYMKHFQLIILTASDSSTHFSLKSWTNYFTQIDGSKVVNDLKVFKTTDLLLNLFSKHWFFLFLPNMAYSLSFKFPLPLATILLSSFLLSVPLYFWRLLNFSFIFSYIKGADFLDTISRTWWYFHPYTFFSLSPTIPHLHLLLPFLLFLIFLHWDT